MIQCTSTPQCLDKQNYFNKEMLTIKNYAVISLMIIKKRKPAALSSSLKFPYIPEKIIN